LKRRKRRPEIEYWANEEDPLVLAGHCQERIDRHFQCIRAGHFWRVVARNWLYYHNCYFDGGADFDFTAVRQITDSMLVAAVNEYRSIIDHIYTIVCQQRLSFEARAKQNDARSFEQAKVAQHVVDHYRRERGLEEALKRAVKHALVMTSGYIHHPWDPWGGEQEAVPLLGRDGEVVLDELGQEKLEIVPQGDFEFANPTIFDIVFDLGVKEWKRNDWLLTRSYENRFELAARQDDNDIAQAIVDASTNNEEDITLFNMGYFGSGDLSSDDFTDIVGVWNFYHLRNNACESGRWFRFIDADTPVSDPQDLPFERIPVTRIVPGEVLMTQLGYSPANDLAAPQELLNAEVSMIASNHMGAGNSIIWAPTGCNLNEDFMGDGVFLLEGGQVPPQGISLQANSPDHERFSNFLLRAMERESGINSVARGQTESNFKSGEALKVMDAKAAQSASPLKESYAMALEDTGTFIVRTCRDMIDGDQERMISIAGERNRTEVGYYTRNDLLGIDRIIVDVSNPITDTISGKMWLAEQLLSRGMISVPQEFLTVVRSGQLDPLLQSDEAQLTRIHEENEQLSKGLPARVDMWTDNHVLDIKEHAALLASPAARGDPQLSASVYSHIGQHFQALMNPQVSWAMQALGFPTVPPPMPFGMGQGGPPAPAPQPQGGAPAPKPLRQLQAPGEQPQAGPGGNMGRMPKQQPTMSP